MLLFMFDNIKACLHMNGNHPISREKLMMQKEKEPNWRREILEKVRGICAHTGAMVLGAGPGEK